MQEGDLIAGRFRLETRAGAGAMGVVFRAADTQHAASSVALKTWRSDSANPLQVDRFLREAAGLADLEEPAIVRHIQHGLTEDGEPFLAMEWIDGPTLAERLAGAGLTAIETLELGQRLLQGLAALHRRGIVHRDLKPSNIMLPRSDVCAAQILDLGVARFAQASTDLTAQGSHLGTPRYMAPEQIRDPRAVDGRADVFALGCVLFECLTGAPAFPGEDPVAVLAQILFGQAPEPSELRSELPEALDELVSSLLVRRPELRPAIGAELRAKFSDLLAPPHRQLLARLARMPALPPRAAALMTLEAAETAWEGAGKRTSATRLLDRASQPVQSFLLPPRQPLLGRQRELAELGEWLQSAGPITLWGGAGVGKTRLAEELMRQAVRQESFPAHAVVLCDLGEAHDSRDVVRITAEAVGSVPLAGDNAEDLFGRALAKLGPLLLVLDRTEHLARELSPLLQLWARAAPALRLLVTSRVRLRGARAYELAPLAVQARGLHPSLPPSQLTSGAGSQPSAAAELVLWLARAEGAKPGASSRPLTEPPSAKVGSVDTRTLAQAERIAQLLEGNPLAIELALARLPLLGLSGILERLPTSLSSQAASSAPLSAAMRAAIEWSWQLLNESERWAFMQCRVFRGSFTLRAAERVLRLPNAANGVLDVIDSLREQSLLVSRATLTQPLDVRLSMPAVLREFALTQLERASIAEPSLAETQRRHAAYCAELAEQADARDDALSPELAHEDWMAAAEYALSPAGLDLGQALTLLVGLERQLLAAGATSRLAAQLTQALDATSHLAEPWPEALALKAAEARRLRARVSAPAGELTQAQTDLEQVQAEAERLHDRRLLGAALLDLGVVQHFRRDLNAARARYEAALDVLSELDDAVAEARCHGNLGAVAHDQAALSEAARGYRRAIALLPSRGQERLLANFQGNLALVEHERGRTVEARVLYEGAIALLESLLDARLLGIVLGNFGTLELAEEQLDNALACLERAHALLEHSGDRRSEGLSLGRLSAALALAGRMPEAEQRAARALRLLRKDAFALPVVSLLASFVDLAGAQRAQREALAEDASEALARVTEACAQARLAQHAGRPLYDQSDDLRLYLAMLEPRLEQARASLAVGT